MVKAINWVKVLYTLVCKFLSLLLVDLKNDILLKSKIYRNTFVQKLIMSALIIRFLMIMKTSAWVIHRDCLKTEPIGDKDQFFAMGCTLLELNNNRFLWNLKGIKKCQVIMHDADFDISFKCFKSLVKPAGC